MCLIIASKNGALTDFNLVERGFRNNPHSWGVMRSNGSRVIAARGFHWESFLRTYDRLGGDPYVIHFRYATHGAVDIPNCHPFKVAPRLYVAHNGIIHIPRVRQEFSDTWHYVERLKEAGVTARNLGDYVPAITKEIGDGNKLAFLDAGGAITLVNPQAGLQYGDVWLSNDWSLPEPFDACEFAYGDDFGAGEYGRCDYCYTRDWLAEVVENGYPVRLCLDCQTWNYSEKYLTNGVE